MLHHTLHVATWCAALFQLSPLQRPCYAGCNAACWRGIAIGSAAVAGVRLARGGLLNVPWHEPRPAVDRCAREPSRCTLPRNMPCGIRLLIYCRRTMRVDVQPQLRRPPGCRRPHTSGRPHCPHTLYCCLSHRPRVHECRACFSAHIVEGGPAPASWGAQDTTESMRGSSSCCTAAAHGPWRSAL